MMDQSITDHLQSRPPPMANYIPSAVPPMSTPNQQYNQQQQQQPPLMTTEQLSHVQYPPTATHTLGTDLSTSNLSFQQQQQQQMAAMMQMQQPWAGTGGYAAPFMMQYPPSMMMIPPQAGSDRSSSRHSSRPPSRQSAAAPVSSSRSSVNGQTGSQTQAGHAMLPMQGYPGFVPPGMYNPWFDPYWQSMMATYQNPYSFGYTDEMMNYWRQVAPKEDDRYSHHSAAYSQSKHSQHSSSMQT
ncbi:unnamed protein product, partial [Rotaria magnacalcarata]